MFKQFLSILICLSLIFLTTACQAEKEVIISPHAYVSVEESPETFKKIMRTLNSIGVLMIIRSILAA